jgi:hypothetical protein
MQTSQTTIRYQMRSQPSRITWSQPNWDDLEDGKVTAQKSGPNLRFFGIKEGYSGGMGQNHPDRD